MSAHATTAPTWPPFDRVLRPGGVSLLHTITQRTDRPANAWIDRYIFPGGRLPTLQSIAALLPERDFRAVDYESMRRHYARTLDEWWQRFEHARERIREMYGERFVRMWQLYLRGAFAAFAYGELDLAQILWTKGPSDAVPMTREYMYPRRRPERDRLAEYDGVANHQPAGNGQPVGAHHPSQLELVAQLNSPAEQTAAPRSRTPPARWSS